MSTTGTEGLDSEQSAPATFKVIPAAIVSVIGVIGVVSGIINDISSLLYPWNFLVAAGAVSILIAAVPFIRPRRISVWAAALLAAVIFIMAVGVVLRPSLVPRTADGPSGGASPSATEGTRRDPAILILAPEAIPLCVKVGGTGRIPPDMALWVFEQDPDNSYWIKGRARQQPGELIWAIEPVEIGSPDRPKGSQFKIVAALAGSTDDNQLSKSFSDGKTVHLPGLPGRVKQIDVINTVRGEDSKRCS